MYRTGRATRGRCRAAGCRQPAQKCDNSRLMQSSLQIAILAAGQGKRMRSALPKVLQLLGGPPRRAHVLSTARKLEPRAICVVDSGGEVRERFADADLTWARQD